MNKEEVKQWLRCQIETSIKIQSKYNENSFYLCYNKQYSRALKLSKITGQPVNINNFKAGEKIIRINTKDKTFLCFDIISNYIHENYSKIYSKRIKIIIEVLNEYEQYKDYNQL